MPERIQGKVVLITGAASGIGRAIANDLASRECILLLGDIDASSLEDTALSLQQSGATVEAHPLDVRDASAVQRFVEAASRRFGRIDYLFNNAGINLFAELLDTTLDDWSKLIDVNLWGVVHGVQAAYPTMCDQGFGHIVNFASVAGIAPTPAEGAYAATKHAVVGLSMALRIEAAAHGVGVSVVCPGAVDTPILTKSKVVKFDPDIVLRLLPEKPMLPSRAAQLIIRDVERGRFFIVLSATTNAFWRVYRAAPEASMTIGELVMKRIRSFKRESS